MSFETARLVFDDPNQLSTQDHIEADKVRWQTLGEINGIVVLLVAHTCRTEGSEEVLRLISARKATRAERARYEQSKYY